MEILVTGGTGFIGTPLVAALLARRHGVRVLTRARSAGRVCKGAEPVIGDALAAADVDAALLPGATLVHLVGTPHPRPTKKALFRRVDQASIEASVTAARKRDVRQLVYLSVAQPAPVMHEYLAVRTEGERQIAAAGLTATILRPWYVLGPGHRWPLVLVPLYAVAARMPGLREDARRLGLVDLATMVAALVAAVEEAPRRGTQRILDVPAIRASATAVRAARR